MKSVLVTGGAGYIGSHTLRHLIEAGFEPVVLDDLSSGHREAVPADVPLVECSLADGQAVAWALRDVRPDAVVHFAGSIEAGESMTDPRRFYANNVVAGLTLLNAIVDTKVVPMVFSSSAAVYGDPEANPIREDALARTDERVWREQARIRAGARRV